MAKLDANLTVSTGEGKDYLCSMSDTYTEIVTAKQKVDNTNVLWGVLMFQLWHQSYVEGSNQSVAAIKATV